MASAVFVLLWQAWFRQGTVPENYYGAILWHAHEMVFGYTLAIVAGFLLTAVRNWTGRDTWSGFPLLGLFLLWLSARLLPFTSVNEGVVAIVDSLFAPVLVVGIALPILRARQWNNLGVVAIVLLAALSNVLFHLAHLGKLAFPALSAVHVGLVALIMLLFVMGGRVIPFFIERGLALRKPLFRSIWLDRIAMLSVITWGTLWALGVDSALVAGAGVLAAFFNAVRLGGWYTGGIWREPMLWSLFLGYAWLPLGLVLYAMGQLGLVNPTASLHALSTGLFGLLIIAMISRVSLGHTGQAISADRPIIWMFVLIALAVIVRSIIPMLLPGQWYGEVLLLSAVLWAGGFGLFLWRFSVPLLRRRPDGRPG